MRNDDSLGLVGAGLVMAIFTVAAVFIIVLAAAHLSPRTQLFEVKGHLYHLHIDGTLTHLDDCPECGENLGGNEESNE